MLELNVTHPTLLLQSPHLFLSQPFLPRPLPHRVLPLPVRTTDLPVLEPHLRTVSGVAGVRRRWTPRPGTEAKPETFHDCQAGGPQPHRSGRVRGSRTAFGVQDQEGKTGAAFCARSDVSRRACTTCAYERCVRSMFHESLALWTSII